MATKLEFAPASTVLADINNTPESPLSLTQRHLQGPYLGALGIRDAVHNAADFVGGKIADAVDFVQDVSPSLPKPSSRLTAALAGSVLALAGAAETAVGAERANASKARASQLPIHPSTFNVFTHASPEAVLGAAQEQPSPLQLNVLGGELVNTIPGHSVDFGQTTRAIESTPSQSAKATYNCPAPTSPRAPSSIQSVEVFPGNNAKLTPCPSNMIVTESHVNPSDPVLAGALAKYKADPFRSGEDWVGDRYGLNVFSDCPDQTAGQIPQTTFKYNSQKGTVRVGFNGSGIGQYCDIVGKSSEQIAVLVQKGKGKFRQVGRGALHNSGLPEILASAYPLPLRYRRNFVTIPDVGNLCKNARSKSKVQMRVRITHKFTGKQSQRFQHQAGQSVGMPSLSRSYTSIRKTICKPS